jgi:3-methylcrotonyl-CoA carboxylase alpha subunit
LQRLAAGLAQSRIAGLATNRDFLGRVLRHPAFIAGDFDTGFIARHREELLPPPSPAPHQALAAASLALLIEQEPVAEYAAERSGDRHSPWHRRDGWRLNGDSYHDILWRDGDTERRVRAHYRSGYYRLDIEGMTVAARAEHDTEGELMIELDGVRRHLAVVRSDADVTVISDDGTWRFSYIDPLAPKAAEEAASGRLTAPMPGKVAQVLVAAGGRVKRGQALMVLEAMKMEHTIAAPADGTVDRVNYAPGDLVEEGAELIAFSAAER